MEETMSSVVSDSSTDAALVIHPLSPQELPCQPLQRTGAESQNSPKQYEEMLEDLSEAEGGEFDRLTQPGWVRNEMCYHQIGHAHTDVRVAMVATKQQPHATKDTWPLVAHLGRWLNARWPHWQLESVSVPGLDAQSATTCREYLEHLIRRFETDLARQGQVGPRSVYLVEGANDDLVRWCRQAACNALDTSVDAWSLKSDFGAKPTRWRLDVVNPVEQARLVASALAIDAPNLARAVLDELDHPVRVLVEMALAADTDDESFEKARSRLGADPLATCDRRGARAAVVERLLSELS